jgi:radical SAM protein with 4Fe4S-binding SPASM domain
LRISFITNAVLLDKHLERLDHPDLDITISMDGASERTYGHFRGTGYFEKVVSNLTQLRERELAGTLPRSSRSFIVVLSQVNVHEMTAIVELAARLGVAVVIFSFQVFFDAVRFQQESLYFAQDSYDRCLAAAVRRANELGVFVIHPDAFRSGMKVAAEELRQQWLWRDDRGHVRCGYVVNQCYVKFHGQVEACCVQDRHPIGNLYEDDLMDIWHGPYYRRLRQSFHTDRWTSVCQNCNAYQSVDVHHKQSHFVIPMRDSGELHSLPQPYRATELEAQYQAAISALSAENGDRAQYMSALQRLTMRDERLHQVTNAIAVLWLLLEQTDKAVRLLRQGADMAPDDPVIAFNLRQALSG